MSSNRYHFDHENHIHSLDGIPLHGTSTIVGEASAKNGLTWWAAELAAVECLEAGPIIPTIRAEVEAYRALDGNERKKALAEIQKKYPVFKAARFAHRNAKEKAAVPGTDMHAHLEDYINSCLEAGGEPFQADSYAAPQVEIFANWAISEVDQFLWSEAHCYSERLWTGGICDFGATLNIGGGICVGDFKSSREAYFGQFVQCGGYAQQIKENGLFDASGNDGMVVGMAVTSLLVFPFGGSCAPVLMDNVHDYTEAFEGAVAMYKAQKKFDKITGKGKYGS